MRGLRLTVAAGLLAFVGLVAVQHPLRPDLPPAEHFISEYAIGSTGALQLLAFLCWAVALAAGALLVWRARVPGRTWARRVAAIGLAFAAAGILAASIFVTQTIAGVLPPDVQRTLTGRLHNLGTVVALAGLVVAAAASLRLVRRRGYRLALAALTAVLLGIVPLLVALGLNAPGVGQRIFVLVGCAFLWRLVVELGEPGLSPDGPARARKRRRSRSARSSAGASTTET